MTKLSAKKATFTQKANYWKKNQRHARPENFLERRAYAPPSRHNGAACKGAIGRDE